MRGRPKIATRFDLYAVTEEAAPAIAAGLLCEHAHLVSDDERRALAKRIAARKGAETRARRFAARRWARYHELESDISALMERDAALMRELRAVRRQALLLKRERAELATELT